MSAAISLVKQQKRKEFQKRYQELSDEACKNSSLELEKRLSQIGIWQEGLVVASYLALKDEISLEPFYRKYQKHLQFVFPKIRATSEMANKQTQMQFVKADPNKKTDWEISPWKNVLQPSGTDFVPLNKIDVFLVPAQVLDREGRRLGRGKGFYDLTLSSSEARGLKLAVSNTCRISNENLPEEAHDVRMDIIVTDDFMFLPLSNSQFLPKFTSSLMKGTRND